MLLQCLLDLNHVLVIAGYISIVCVDANIRQHPLHRYFHPIEVFPPEVSNNMMCYLMIHDTTSPASASSPTTILDNPGDIFMWVLVNFS